MYRYTPVHVQKTYRSIASSPVTRFCREISSLVIIVIVPLVTIPLITETGGSKEGKCAYGIAVVALFWVTEVLPIAVTSLIPVFLFPLLGVLSSADVCSSYMKDTIMLLLGSLIVGVSVESTNLHKRIAVRVLLLMGTEPKWLLAGIMLPTWFLSMWMSNTATTAMMVTIVSAILLEVKHVMLADHRHTELDNIEADQSQRIEDATVKDKNEEDTDSHEYREFLNLAKSFAIAVAYAANTGGIATLTGTPPNLVFKGEVDDLYAKHGMDSPISFANWLVVGFPTSVLLLILTWLWLQLYFFPKGLCPCCTKKNRDFKSVRPILQKEYASLGSFSFAEVVVLINFIVLALLWITRKPEFVDGWGTLFTAVSVRDSAPAMLIAVFLSIIPAYLPGMERPRSAAYNVEKDDGTFKYMPILSWKRAQEKVPWGVLLLMGGGFAVADAAKSSGLSDWISSELVALGDLSPWIIVLILTVIVAAFTELTSNTATVSILLPIVSSLALSLEINPLYFMVPTTMATSFAFMLPVATPPNAIVFSTGYLKVPDMARCGLMMNIVAIFILNVATNTWGKEFFDMGVFPPEMLKTNVTSA